MASLATTNSVNSIQLFVAKFRDFGDLDSSSANSRQGVDTITDEHIRSRIRFQVGSDFESNFVNYTNGKILCVNTPKALVAFQENGTYKPSGLKFTLVFMPEEFKGKRSSLSSGYLYGESLTISIVASSNSRGDNEPSYGYEYRDANRKGRSVLGESQGAGVGIGVWS
ncbi:hypothetical protein OAE97_00210 [Verrucomicrobia bacterium]|nr:hypothetical protein [Verrucomicrobiota bacterium]